MSERAKEGEIEREGRRVNRRASERECLAKKEAHRLLCGAKRGFGM